MTEAPGPSLPRPRRRRRRSAPAPARRRPRRPRGPRLPRRRPAAAGRPALLAERADQRLDAQLREPRRLGHLLHRPDQHRPGRLRDDRRLHHRHPLHPLWRLRSGSACRSPALVAAAVGTAHRHRRSSGCSGVYFAMITLSPHRGRAARLPERRRPHQGRHRHRQHPAARRHRRPGRLLRPRSRPCCSLGLARRLAPRHQPPGLGLPLAAPERGAGLLHRHRHRPLPRHRLRLRLRHGRHRRRLLRRLPAEHLPRHLHRPGLGQLHALLLPGRPRLRARAGRRRLPAEHLVRAPGMPSSSTRRCSTAA